jgi:hypothetical protein
MPPPARVNVCFFQLYATADIEIAHPSLNEQEASNSFFIMVVYKGVAYLLMEMRGPLWGLRYAWMSNPLERSVFADRKVLGGFSPASPFRGAFLLLALGKLLVRLFFDADIVFGFFDPDVGEFLAIVLFSSVKDCGIEKTAKSLSDSFLTLTFDRSVGPSRGS